MGKYEEELTRKAIKSAYLRMLFPVEPTFA